jgi:hypothetical protein
VPSFGRFVSVSTNAKEFQKRTFFYAQDTWRVTPRLTLNLGLRWELYFPEAVNGAGNGALMDLNTGYIHVAGIGGVPSDMGWTIDKPKQFAPRIGITYQLDSKTVIRAGYGRSFDTGVFGSIFGHTVTQNIPVLANQQINEPGGSTACEFNLGPGSDPRCVQSGVTQQGPPAYVFPAVPANGLLPNPGYGVSTATRQNPLTFPSVDAWNLSAQRALTPTLALTLAYVANKGTHTLGDGDGNTTNPNEAALSLPGAYSVTGQTLNWDANGPKGVLPAGYSGGVSNGSFLQRYYGGKLAACSDPAYATPTGEPNIAPGMCGWEPNVNARYDSQNTEFDALQVTLAKQLTKGLAVTGNYQWASAFDDNTGYWTWSHSVPHMRDSNVRNQQLSGYGSYDLPFGKGKQFVPDANRATDLIIGGFQLSGTANWSGGLPFTVGYDDFLPSAAGTPLDEDCSHSTGGTAAPCLPNVHGHMKTSLTAFSPASKSRSFFTAQSRTGGVFSWPGLDRIGNEGQNNYRGPKFFTSDLGLTKAFTVWENVAVKFRMDAYNAFNHINAGNPGNGDAFGSASTPTGSPVGVINGEANGCVGSTCGPRQMEFSLRVQF